MSDLNEQVAPVEESLYEGVPMDASQVLGDANQEQNNVPSTITEQTTGIKDLLHQSQVQGLSNPANPFQGGREQMADFNNPHIQNQFYDRYKGHGDFDELGFDPFINNEKKYTEQGSFTGDMSRAAGEWAVLAGLGFRDVLPFNWGALSDAETARKYDRATGIGSSNKEGISGFTTNLFLNSGYTIGILGELAAEEAVLMAAEFGLTAAGFFTGGATWVGSGVVAARMGQKVLNVVDKLKDVYKIGKNLKKTMASFKEAGAARKFFKAAGNFVNPLENTIGFLKNAEKYKDLNKLGKTAKGFGAFYRDVRTVRLAYSEASLEGGMTQNEMERSLLAEYKKANNGELPNDEEAGKIRMQAMEAGHTVAKWNMPAIYFSDKLMFDGLLKGKFRSLGASVMEGDGGKILYSSVSKKGRDAGKLAYRRLSENYFKEKLAYIKNPKLWLQGAAKYGKANVTEGLQEVTQDFITDYSKKYYTSKYVDGDVTMGGHMQMVADNLKHTFSGAGLETFMSGFLMGGMISPVSNFTAGLTGGGTEKSAPVRAGKSIVRGVQSIVNKTAYEKGATKRKAARASRAEALDKDIELLNQLYNDPKMFLSADMMNLIEQKEYAAAKKIAGEAGDEKMFHDMKNGSFNKHITTALKYGRLNDTLGSLKEMKQLSEQEIKESYGIDKQEFDKIIDVSTQRAEDIGRVWTMAMEKYPNPHDPSQFKRGTEPWKEAQEKHNAWNTTIEEMVFNQDSFTTQLDRINKITETTLKESGLEKVPFTEFNILFDDRGLENEKDLLKDTIKSFDNDDSHTAESARYIEEKKKKLKLLEDYTEALDTLKGNTNENEEYKPEDRKALLKAYKAYAQHLADKHDDYVNIDKLDKSLERILDVHALKGRNRIANDAVNTLLTPHNFVSRYEQNLEMNIHLMNNRKKTIEDSLIKYRNIKDKNKMLNDLYELGMFFEPKQLKDLEEKGIVPDEFFYLNKEDDTFNAEVTVTSADYEKAVGVLRDALDIDLRNLNIPEHVSNPYEVSKSREKDPKDKRNYKTLAAQYGFNPESASSTVLLTDVLKSVMESDFATDREKALAEELLKKADPNEQVTFVNNAEQKGSYTAEKQSVIDARYAADEFMFGEKGQPIEHVILYNEIMRRTMDSVTEDSTSFDKDFLNNINTLRNAVFEAMAEFPEGYIESVTGMNENDVRVALSKPETFIAAATTNDMFQAVLASINTTQQVESSKTSWQQFIDLILDNISKVLNLKGENIEGTVLNATLDLINNKIHQVEKTATGETKARKKAGDLNISDLMKPENEKLLNNLVILFKTTNAKLLKSKADPLIKDIGLLEDADIVNSSEFANFINSPDYPKKNRLIAAHIKLNKSTAKEEKKAEPKARVEGEKIEPKEVTKPAGGIPMFVTRAMQASLSKLGYSASEIKKFRPKEAHTIIDEGLTKDERQHNKDLDEQQKTNNISKEKVDKNEAFLKAIKDVMANVTNGEQLEQAREKVMFIISENPKATLETVFTVEKLNKLIDEKKQELKNNVNFDNIQVGEVLIMADSKDYGKTAAVVTSKSEKGITIKYLQGEEKTTMVDKKDIKDRVSLTYAQAVEIEKNPEVEKEETITEEDTTVSVESMNNTLELSKEEMAALVEEGKTMSKEDIEKDFDDLIC